MPVYTMNKLFTPNGIDERILEGAARALWASKYADASDEGELPEGSPTASCGADWCDVSPETPIRAYTHAAVLLDRVLLAAREAMKNLKHIQCLWQVFADACDLSEYDSLDAELATMFGHYLAMESMGSGVAWRDSHKDLEFVVPHTLEGICYHDLIN